MYDNIVEKDIFNMDENLYQSIDKTFSKEQKISIHIFLQNEITKEMAIFKDDLNKKFINYDNRMFTYVNDLENEIKNLIIKVNDLFSKTNICLAKSDKIDNLVEKIDKMNELLTFHDVRINNLIKDLSNACFKYDKIYLNNLILPGKIGDFCKYKNLKEYLEYTFNQFLQFENYNKKQGIILKEFKDKIDNLDNDLSRQINTLKQTNFDFMNLKIDELKGFQNQKINELKDDIQKTKIEFESNKINMKKEIKDLNNSLNNENDKNDLKNIINEYDLLKTNFISLIKYIKQLHYNKNINKNEIIRTQINKLILNLMNSDKNQKIEDEKIENIINEISETKNNIKSRLKMRSLTNKSIRQFKEDEKKIKAESLDYNSSSKKLPVSKYYSSLNIISTKNKIKHSKSIIENIKEKNNCSSDISSKNNSIEYNSDSSSSNFKEEVNENNNNVNNDKNENENNLLQLIKNNENDLKSIKDDLNNKIEILDEKIKEMNNSIQKYFNKLQSKKKEKKLCLNISKDNLNNSKNSKRTLEEKNNINEKLHFSSIPIQNTSYEFRNKINPKNSFYKNLINTQNSSFYSIKRRLYKNNSYEKKKEKSIYDKFLFEKKKLEENENTILIGNFLKPLKNSLINIPQIHPLKTKKKSLKVKKNDKNDV